MTHDHEKHSFAVILSEADGDERFRTTVIACNREQAVEKAAVLAERLHVEVELVEPAESPRMVMLVAEGPDGDVASERE